MRTFTRPVNLNGAELKQELAAAGIIVSDIVDFANGTIGFDTTNEEKAKEIVAAHDGTVIPPEPSVQDKLASVGLNLDDLKAALGL